MCVCVFVCVCVCLCVCVCVCANECIYVHIVNKVPPISPWQARLVVSSKPSYGDVGLVTSEAGGSTDNSVSAASTPRPTRHSARPWLSLVSFFFVLSPSLSMQMYYFTRSGKKLLQVYSTLHTL